MDGLLHPAAAIVESLHFRLLNPSELVAVFIVCVIVWLFVGLLAWKTFRRKGSEYASRYVSVCHAALSTVVCGMAALDNYKSRDWGMFGAVDSTGLQQVALINTAAYFTMDFVGILVSDYFSWLFVVHHTLCGGCLMYCAFSATNCFNLSVVTFLMELSNPFFHARWLLSEEGVDEGAFVFSVVNELFFSLYFVTRVVVSPFLTWRYLSSDNPAFMKLSSLGLQVVSIQFFIEKVKHRLTGKPWK